VTILDSGTYCGTAQCSLHAVLGGVRQQMENDFYLKAKAKIWPRLSYICQIPGLMCAMFREPAVFPARGAAHSPCSLHVLNPALPAP